MWNAANAKPDSRQNGRLSILFFSRGRGRGHAVPDLTIAEALPGFLGDFDLQFVSYATGAEVLRGSGFPVIDLAFPEENPFMDTLQRAARLIGERRPDVVVAHEEFAVPPAARIFGVPTIFITDWFPPRSVLTECVACADAIVFIGSPGVFPVPDPVRTRTHYVGPVTRRMTYGRDDRVRARRELDIPPDALVVSVIPGAWATEGKSPLLNLLLPAFDAINTKRATCVLWAASSDHPDIVARCADRPYIRVLHKHPVIEQLMVASDVAITKGNRGSIFDLASLGIPSISLSSGSNAVDDMLVARIPSNLALNVEAIDSRFVARCVEEVASRPATDRPSSAGLYTPGGEAAAKVLAAEIVRVIGAGDTIAHAGTAG